MNTVLTSIRRLKVKGEWLKVFEEVDKWMAVLAVAPSVRDKVVDLREEGDLEGACRTALKHLKQGFTELTMNNVKVVTARALELLEAKEDAREVVVTLIALCRNEEGEPFGGYADEFEAALRALDLSDDERATYLVARVDDWLH